MRVESISPSGCSAALLAGWSELLSAASEPSIFLSPEWVNPWWRHYGAGREPRLVVAWNGHGRLAGLAPIYLHRLRLAGFPGPLVASLMTDQGVGSEYLGFLARPGEERPALEALAGRLQGEWALADFRGIREGGAAARLIPELLARAAPARLHVERHPCSRIPLPADYEAYLASLPQKFRSTVRYRTNKLVKNFSVRFFRTDREEDLDGHLKRFFDLHQNRWTAEGHPGSFYDPEKRAFYREVAAGFLQRGWLRFYHLEVDGVIRASQFGFAHGGVLHSLQEAFDRSFRPPGVGGIGVVLRGMAIRESIAEGLLAYDFLGGTEEFKTRWGTATHYVQRIRIGAPGAAGALAFSLTAGRRRAKDWGRSHAPTWIVGSWEWLGRVRRERRVRRVRKAGEGQERT